MPAPIRGPWFNRPGWSEYKAARGGGGKHWGYDSYCAPHSTIYAIGTGEVVAKGYAAGGYGHYIDVFYPDLNVRQREAHMAEESYLNRGAKVTAMTALGRVGRTGNAKNIYWIRNGVELWHDHSQSWTGNTTAGARNVDPRNYWGGTAGDDITPIEEEKEDNMLRWYLREDGNVSFADQYTVIDFGDSNRVNIVAAKLCPDQAAPIKLSAHEDAIMREECNKRLAAFHPSGVGVDLDALAQKIAPLVTAAPHDYAALAKAVNDDLHARTAQ